MKELKVYGTNLFLVAKIGQTNVLVGCATGFKRSVKNTAQDVSCPGNGNAKSYLPGRMPDFDISFDGISYIYTGADAANNVGVKNFWDSCAIGTVIELYISSEQGVNSDTPFSEKTIMIVESCDESSSKQGEASTYSVSGKASGGWLTIEV